MNAQQSLSRLFCESEQNKEKHILTKFRTDLFVVWMECREMLDEHPVNSVIIYYQPRVRGSLLFSTLNVFNALWAVVNLFCYVVIVVGVPFSSCSSYSSLHHILRANCSQSQNRQMILSFWVEWIQNTVLFTGHLTMDERERNIFQIIILSLCLFCHFYDNEFSRITSNDIDAITFDAS